MTEELKTAKYHVTNPMACNRVINTVSNGVHKQKLIPAGTAVENVEIADVEADHLRAALKKNGAGKEVSLVAVVTAAKETDPKAQQQPAPASKK